MKIKVTDIEAIGTPGPSTFLRGDGAWGAAGGGGGSFSGARVFASSAFSQGSGNSLVSSFNTVDFDVGSWWNPAGYFVIPPGVEYITATLYITDADSVVGQLIPVIEHRNSSGTLLGVISQSDYESTGGDSGETTTGAFKVSAGDRIYPATFLTNVRTLDGGKYGCSFSIHALTSGSSGGGVAWTLAGTWTWSTNVPNVDFTGLAGANEILVIAGTLPLGGLTTSSVVTRQVVLSVDNGVNFFTAIGDYRSFNANGTMTTTNAAADHSNAADAARSVFCHILNANVAGQQKLCYTSNGNRYFVASTDPINAIRVKLSGSGNITGGDIRVYTR